MTTPAQAEYEARRALERRRGKDRKKRAAGRDIAIPTLAAACAEKVNGQPCRLCELAGKVERDVEAHHIVHRGRIGSRHPLVHMPANLMPLCHAHHQDHHNTAHRRVPREALLPSELQFAIDQAGNGWVDRWYPTIDAREVS